MAQLEGIHIQNFRSLKDVRLGKTFDAKGASRLPKMLALIGPNGSGKSALLDAFGFIGDCLREGVEAACDKPHRGGFQRLRTRGVEEPIRFELHYREKRKSRPISYSLHIDVDGHGRPHVLYERLRQRRRGQRKGWPFSFLELKEGSGFVWSGVSTEEQEGNQKEVVELFDTTQLGITTLGNLREHERIVAFRNFLERWYLSYFIPDLARVLPSAGAQKHLNRRGDNLANYLQYIERRSPKRFQQLLEAMSKKIPGLKFVTHHVSQDNRLLLRFGENGYSESFFAQDMSDGTLKTLAYLLLLADPDPAPLIGIEEPENGLHHQLLLPLAQEMKRVSREAHGPQIMVTTHSPYLADALAPEDVWILHKEQDGFTAVKNAAEIPEVVALFREGLPLGELWYSNHFGIGNPNVF